MIKRIAFENSAHRILLLDYSKFNSRGSYRTYALSEFDCVACDRRVELPSNVQLAVKCAACILTF